MRCDHCDTRIEEAKPFRYEAYDLCCNCMSALCSWFLDGGDADASIAYIASESCHAAVGATTEPEVKARSDRG